jgi:hypothetical protein
VDEIHKAILEWNQHHFHQADDTLFAGGAEDTILYDLIGNIGMSKASKDIVDGTFMEKYGNKCDILLETEQIIWELAMPKEIKVLGKKIDSKISEEDFIDGFKGVEGEHINISIRMTFGTLHDYCYRSRSPATET